MTDDFKSNEISTLKGWLNINKPIGLTSNDVVCKLKKKLGLKPLKIKIGHAGTLDPMATGVLPIAISREYTKQIDSISGQSKDYDFTIQFGIKTDTLDITGNILERSTALEIDLQLIEDSLHQFCGEISQTPPNYSAIKINGTRAYDLARSGETFEIPARKISIYQLRLISFNKQDSTAQLFVSCSKGTYVRSLGESIAHAIGTIGCVSQINRSRVGEFKQANSVDLEQVDIKSIYY